MTSIWGNVLPMNVNWNPDTYENIIDFKRKLAVPELVKWFLLILLPPLAFTTSIYLKLVAQISCYIP